MDPIEVPPVTKAETEDILDIVDDLIVHLHEAKTMPLSSNALVDREVFLTRLETLRASLPDELRAARWMVREREAFISRTNEKARELIDNARKEADALVAESNIVAEAVEEANILGQGTTNNRPHCGQSVSPSASAAADRASSTSCADTKSCSS